MRIIALIIFIPALVAAQEAPKPKTSDSLKALFVANYALTAIDVAVTKSVLSKPGGYERDPLFGRHPSTARLAIESAALATLVNFGAWRLERTGHPRAAKVVMFVRIGQESYAVANNARNVRR
jgi:hypothetical protein